MANGRFDRVADVYDATRGGEPRGHAVAEAIQAMLPADPILEIGVGTGLVAAALTQLGRTVLGVDLSAAMLAHAHRRLPGRLARADAVQLPVRQAAVGGFAIVWVLHVVADPGAVLAEAHRVLRPDGRGVVLAPDTGDESPPRPMWQSCSEGCGAPWRRHRTAPIIRPSCYRSQPPRDSRRLARPPLPHLAVL